jgi:hypothetical protein
VVRASVRLARAGDQVRRAFGIRTRNPGANPNWKGTRVGFCLHGEQTTNVRFYHTGWPMANEHWRISCYCRAMYLRILRRYLEHGESVPYETRLDA